MRTKTEIITEQNQIQVLCNRLTMEIGQGFAQVARSNDNNLKIALNQKVDEFNKAESKLRMLEVELANTPE